MSGFSGILYRERDLRNLLNAADFEITSLIRVQDSYDGHDRLWCTVTASN